MYALPVSDVSNNGLPGVRVFAYFAIDRLFKVSLSKRTFQALVNLSHHQIRLFQTTSLHCSFFIRLSFTVVQSLKKVLDYGVCLRVI